MKEKDKNIILKRIKKKVDEKERLKKETQKLNIFKKNI